MRENLVRAGLLAGLLASTSMLWLSNTQGVHSQGNYVSQSGNVTNGHLAGWVTNGVIGDGGSLLLGTFTANDAVCVNGNGAMIDCGVAMAAGLSTGQLLIAQGSGTPAWKTQSGDTIFGANGVSQTAKVNSVAFPSSPSTNTVPVVTSSNQVTWETVPVAAGGTNCSSASGACVDNISGFNTTGLLQRTGAGTYQTQAYNQGTWTPTLQGLGTVGTVTYSIQVGSYEQIGRQVAVRFNVLTTSVVGVGGAVLLGGLPFTSNNTTGDLGACVVSEVTGWTADNSFIWVAGIINPNNSVITLSENKSGGTTSTIPGTDLSGTTNQWVGYCNYHV